MSRRWGTPWTDEQVRDYKSRHHSPVRAPDVEYDTRSFTTTTHSFEVAVKKCRIEVHSRLRRPGDPDGRSVKAVLDGLVAGGLLRDDSSKTIESITFTQEKAHQDETVIRIIEV